MLTFDQFVEATTRQQGVANVITHHIPRATNWDKGAMDQMSTHPFLKQGRWKNGKQADAIQLDVDRFYQDEKNPLKRAFSAVRDVLRGRPLNMSKSVRSVPLDKIRTPQPTVSRKVVIDKIQGEHKAKDQPRLPIFAHDKKKDEFTLLDGNHRAVGRAARSFKQIRGFVVTDNR